ncbi:MAG: rRNA maturation RNase YbeY [Dehalococcoidia bacterium]
MRGYDISIEVTVDPAGADIGALRVLAERVMRGEQVEDGTGLSVLITGDAPIRELNRQFLGVDEPTDVLSFPDEAADFVEADGPPYLGDIAISLETAKRQAADLEHSLDAELAHLLVHGILHLCGYDHVDDAGEERRMRAREEHYLGDLSAAHAS